MVETQIMASWKQRRGIYGYLRTRTWLVKTHGTRVNHKRVDQLMQELGISSVIWRKKRNYGSEEAFVISDSKLNREFQATRPFEKWVADITYLPFGHSFLYCSTIFDLYNNEVVAYKLSTSNDLRLIPSKRPFTSERLGSYFSTAILDSSIPDERIISSSTAWHSSQYVSQRAMSRQCLH
ncbi:hypothetical protein A616_28780 [Brevibacillus brevis X23]|nr:hypothetical protein A616_28780 [Brevibacillus brevis X23]